MGDVCVGASVFFFFASCSSSFVPFLDPDSRAVLSRKFMAEALSFDHKPDREDERRRIESAGAVVARTCVCVGV